MNIGIVIGISEYTDVANNLPGCHKDAKTMHDILKKTGKYDEILYINQKLESALVKEKLTDFFSTHKKDDIAELLLYYTGHGEFYNNEFYFQLSDYDPHKRKQTSLQNEEVDNLIKTLSPGLVVKIIDACQSGKSYIKEANGVSKYFEKTQERFNRCYFLNSSLNNQSSYQSDIISDFTKSFILSLKGHNSSEIRYKDIIDFISDEFEGNGSQTPFFVIQADYTEKFCSIDESLKAYLDSLKFNIEKAEKDKAEAISLLDKIKKQAENYSGKEEALQLVDTLQEEAKKFSIEGDLKSVFELNISFHEDYDPIVKKNVVGKWLDDNDHEFFAQSKHKRVRKDRYTNPFGVLQAAQLFGQQNDDDYELIMAGFDLEIEVPYKTMVFDLNSRFPNVDSFTCRVVYLLSKRQIAFFYFTTNFEEKNWDKKALNTNVEWIHSDYPITKTEEVVLGLKKIFEHFQLKVTEYLEERFNKKENEEG